jgi:hypothetical protein
MGNWRTVNVTGTMSAAGAAALRAWLGYTYEPGDAALDHFGPLSFSLDSPSLCGLGDWPAEQVSRCGNLAERDYSVQDVADELRKLVHIAPSMLLKVHCGGEYESGECVATISVGEGVVAIGGPERETVDGPSEAQILGNFARNLLR